MATPLFLLLSSLFSISGTAAGHYGRESMEIEADGDVRSKMMTRSRKAEVAVQSEPTGENKRPFTWGRMFYPPGAFPKGVDAAQDVLVDGMPTPGDTQRLVHVDSPRTQAELGRLQHWAAGNCAAQSVECFYNSSLEVIARNRSQTVDELFSPESTFWQRNQGDVERREHNRSLWNAAPFVYKLRQESGGCLMWHRGHYNSCDCSSSQPVAEQQPSEICAKCMREGRGGWDQTEKRFVAPPECGCTDNRWTRCQLLKKLSGLKIAVLGDSLGRQIYLKLLSILRMGGMTIDHYYHTDSSFWATETEDCHHINTLEKCPPMPSANGVRINFIFSPTNQNDTISDLQATAMEEKYDAIILQSGYWYTTTEFLSTVEEKIRSRTESAVSVPMFHVTVPSCGARDYKNFNEQLRQKNDKTPGMYSLDLERIAMAAEGDLWQMSDNERQLHHWRNEEDQTHFGCGVEPMAQDARLLDNGTGLAQRFKGYKKYMKSWDCDDPVNRGVIDAFLASLPYALEEAKSRRSR